jgi:hypothetical protein
MHLDFDIDHIYFGDDASGYSMFHLLYGYFIYLWASLEMGIIKIGFTTNPTGRVCELRRCALTKRNFLVLFKIRNARQVENGLHRAYYNHGVGSEGFRIDWQYMVSMILAHSNTGLTLQMVYQE